MPEHEAEKMIGGYASGTLTADERRLLFEAALRNQEVFDALAEDHALKDLLDDPITRRRVIDGMGAASAGDTDGWSSRAAAWLRQPGHLALAGSLATALLVSLVVIEVYRQGAPPPSEAPHSSDLREADRPAADVAPATPQPGSKPDRTARVQKSAPAAKAAAQRPGGWRVTRLYGKRAGEGPARSLFYGGRQEKDAGIGGVALEERTASPTEAPAPEGDRLLQRAEQAATAAPLGLRYQIGDDKPGAPELRIQTNQTGYLYVVELTRDGARRLLFPVLSSKEADLGTIASSALVQPGISYAVKLGQRLESLKDEGSYRVVVRVSRRPLRSFTSAPTTSDDRRLFDETRRMRHTASLVTQHVPEEGGASYVISPSTDPEAVISVTISFEVDQG